MELYITVTSKSARATHVFIKTKTKPKKEKSILNNNVGATNHLTFLQHSSSSTEFMREA
jgi:hypothetical protein